MCEDKETCDWYDNEGWKTQNCETLTDFAMKMAKQHLFGSTSLECPCCGWKIDPDANCGNCGWENAMLRLGII